MSLVSQKNDYACKKLSSSLSANDFYSLSLASFQLLLVRSKPGLWTVARPWSLFTLFCKDLERNDQISDFHFLQRQQTRRRSNFRPTRVSSSPFFGKSIRKAKAQLADMTPKDKRSFQCWQSIVVVLLICKTVAIMQSLGSIFIGPPCGSGLPVG